MRCSSWQCIVLRLVMELCIVYYWLSMCLNGLSLFQIIMGQASRLNSLWAVAELCYLGCDSDKHSISLYEHKSQNNKKDTFQTAYPKRKWCYFREKTNRYTAFSSVLFKSASMKMMIHKGFIFVLGGLIWCVHSKTCVCPTDFYTHYKDYFLTLHSCIPICLYSPKSGFNW